MLFDGNCRFCTQSAKKLARTLGPSRTKTVSFQDDGVLASFPGVTYEACMKRLHLVTPDGRVYSGAGAVARIFREFRFVGWLTYLYYVPVLKQLADLGYALIAKYRYKLFGRTHQCEPGGTCHLHG
jgi:predicted DCC family thiol-disulfide oxidoreductase YuxK